MGKRCCCNSTCKICSECESAPTEAKSFNFTRSTVTFSGFQDWIYDQTYHGEFATKYDPAFFDKHAGYRPGDTTYDLNWFSYETLSMGNASVRYKLSITNLEILNGSYTFTKDSKTCRFTPDGEYRLLLGQVTAESFFEFNIAGNLYSFFPVPPPLRSVTTGIICNSFPFDCLSYRGRFHTSPISGWDGKIGTKIIFDVYAISSEYSTGNDCGSHSSPVVFEFRIKETEPIATGIYSNYGKKKLGEVTDAPCVTVGLDGCPVSNCSWSNYNTWSSCLTPFDNTILYDYDVRYSYFRYTDVRYPNQSCWRQCGKYLNHTNFTPFFSFWPKNYLFLIDDFEGLCDKYHSIKSLNIIINNFCNFWNGANQTVSKQQNVLDNIYFSASTSEATLDNSKIYSPCSDCGAGTGIGYSLRFNFLTSIFYYIFRYSGDYQPPGIDNGGTSVNNMTVPIPSILRSEWGSSFTLNTTNGYISPFDTPPPTDIYNCGLTKSDVPNDDWTLVSNSISSAWITGTQFLPRFILTEPLQPIIGIVYE